MTNTRSYSELIKLPTFENRFAYLKLEGDIGRATFGFDRWLNQQFYASPEWKQARRYVIFRDEGCDLGVPGFEIYGAPLVHHINPMVSTDIIHGEEWIINPEYLITTTHITHNAIHYGGVPKGPATTLDRAMNDTALWPRR